MWKLIEQEREEDTDNILDFPKISSSEKTDPNEPDFIDYDGMGNQGRFPKRN